MSQVSSSSRAQQRYAQRRALLEAWRGAAEPKSGRVTAKSVAVLVDPIIKQAGLKDRVGLEAVLEAWREIVGDFLYQHSRPDGLNRGVLTVRLLQPAVHHALVMEKPRILGRLRGKLGHLGVRDLRFRHG